jgi:hypothetical protein
MAVSNEEYTATLIDEMRVSELDEATKLFLVLHHQLGPLNGVVGLADGQATLQWRFSSQGQVMLLTHEYGHDPEITETGTLVEKWRADKYVLGIAGDQSAPQPQWSAHKGYDITRERELRTKVADINSELTGFQADGSTSIPTENAQRVNEIATDKMHTEAIICALHALRDAEVPDGSKLEPGLQLTAAQRMRQLLEEARDVAPRQLAQAIIGREADGA